VGGIVKRGGRQPLEPPDEVRSHASHPPQHGREAIPADPPNLARVEAIGMGHALEPLDTIATAASDELQPSHRLLVTGQQMTEDVLHRPAVLSAWVQDLLLRQLVEEC
jgi:hypothetical protein